MSTSKPKMESSLSMSEKKDSKKDVDKKSKPVKPTSTIKSDKKNQQGQSVGDISPPLLLSLEPMVSSTLDIQFGHFEKLFHSNQNSKNSDDVLIAWPKNDVIVEEQPRKTRTGSPVLPVSFFINSYHNIN